MAVGMALSRPVLRLLYLIAAIACAALLYNLAIAPVGEGVLDASSWADRRTAGSSSIFGEANPNGVVWDTPSSHDTGTGAGVDSDSDRSGSFWQNPFRSTPRRPAKPPSYRDSTPRPLPRVNTTLATRNNIGVSRVVKPNTNPEEYDEGPLPNLDEAFKHLEPMLRAVKEKHQNIPREHQLWEPIFPPFLTDDLQERFWHLREEWDPSTKTWKHSGDRRFLLVTICRQVAGMLADWFATWTVLADFLGPETLHFSLLEGDSADGSGEILSEVMRDHLLYLGVPPQNINIRTMLPKLDWEQNHRIELLAQMRNTGMKPLYDTAPDGLTWDGKPWSAVVFYNDVYLSATHFLELLHQHFMQDADMTCGWDHAGRWFYDGWVGRDMSGDLYTPFPVKDEDKDLPQKLFVNHPNSRLRHEQNLPFQVFAGWNGIAVMNPRPFFPPYNVQFRRGTPKSMLSMDWECQASESSFISWDFWKYGFGRILTVPGVHACYGKGDAQLRGWVEFPAPRDGFSEAVTWQDKPPRKIRCHDWPDKLGKGYWAWDTVRWVDPPKLEVL